MTRLVGLEHHEVVVRFAVDAGDGRLVARCANGDDAWQAGGPRHGVARQGIGVLRNVLEVGEGAETDVAVHPRRVVAR